MIGKEQKILYRVKIEVKNMIKEIRSGIHVQVKCVDWGGFLLALTRTYISGRRLVWNEMLAKSPAG